MKLMRQLGYDITTNYGEENNGHSYVECTKPNENVSILIRIQNGKTMSYKKTTLHSYEVLNISLLEHKAISELIQELGLGE